MVRGAALVEVFKQNLPALSGGQVPSHFEHEQGSFQPIIHFLSNSTDTKHLVVSTE